MEEEKVLTPEATPEEVAPEELPEEANEGKEVSADGEDL